MSRFHEHMRQAEAVIDDVHADDFRLLPMIEDQYAGAQPDPTRQVMEFAGVLELDGASADIGALAEVAAHRPRLHVRSDVAAVTAVRPGDVIEALDGSRAFIVRAIHRDGISRVALELVERK